MPRLAAAILVFVSAVYVERGLGQGLSSGEKATRLRAVRLILAEAVKEAAAIQDPGHRVMLKTLARAQARSGDVASARQTLGGIQEAGARAEVLRAIAVAEARAKDGKAARQTVAAIPGDYARREALVSVVRAQARAGDVAGALQTAASAKEDPLAARMLGEVAVAQAFLGDLEAARQTSQLITDPRWQDQFRLLVALQQGRAGDLAGALATASAIRPGPARLMALGGLAVARAEGGDEQGVRRVLALVPDERERAAILPAVLEKQAAAGHLTAALSTLRDVPAGEREVAMGDIARAQARAGDVAGAMRTVEGIKDRTARASALRAVAVARMKAGDPSGALQVAAAKGFEYEKDETLRAIAEAQAQSGDPTGARRTAAMIGSSMTRDGVQWTIAVARATAGDVSEVLAQARTTSATPEATSAFRLQGLLRAADEILDELDEETVQQRRLLPFAR